MAALDLGSNQHWKELHYGAQKVAMEGFAYMVEDLRASYMEGTIGLRESIALKNVPPVIVEQRLQPGQGGSVST